MTKRRFLPLNKYSDKKVKNHGSYVCFKDTRSVVFLASVYRNFA